jgi:hypothetical protein
MINCTLSTSAIGQTKCTLKNNHSWLFLNVENNMSIILSTKSSSKIKIYSNLGHYIKVDSLGNFRFKPKTSRDVKFKVYSYQEKDSTLIHEEGFTVKPLPKATAMLGGNSKSQISKNELLAQIGIRAEVINYNFNISVPIKSYTLILLKDKQLVYFEDCKGAKLTSGTKKELAKLIKGGERLIITNIETNPYYHFNKYINSIEIKIKN